MKKYRWSIASVLSLGVMVLPAPSAIADESVIPALVPAVAGAPAPLVQSVSREAKPTSNLRLALARELRPKVQLDENADEGSKDKGNKTFIQSLSDAGFKLRRSTQEGDEGEAAALSFLKSAGSDSVFSADFALIWEQPNHAGSTLLGGSIEGSVASDREAAQNYLRVRLHGDSFGHWDDSTNGYHVKYGGKYETDQSARTQTLVAELWLTPTIKQIGIGRFISLAGMPARWRPSVAINAGRYLRGGEDGERTDLRIAPRARAEVYLTRAQRPKATTPFFYVDDFAYFLPLQSGGPVHNFLIVGLQFPFNDNVSLGFSYKVGRDAPEFQKIETIGGTLGLSF